MLRNSYKDWTAFRFQGKDFLALESGTKVHIYGKGFSNYGSWMTVDSFKKNYKKDGEAICLEP
jgi:hypothetical protein